MASSLFLTRQGCIDSGGLFALAYTMCWLTSGLLPLLHCCSPAYCSLHNVVLSCTHPALQGGPLPPPGLVIKRPGTQLVNGTLCLPSGTSLIVSGKAASGTVPGTNQRLAPPLKETC
jgi:hypothetical protein